ncbi:hypothetical protein TKK_0010049 [Trichogramma kaykai]
MGVKGKKEKKARKRNVANELDTVTYEQQILDNNRQLARLRSRNEELELEAEKLKDKLLQLEENKADLTSHLQRILQRKVEEAEELQERLLALEKLRKDEQKANKMKIERMEQEFKTMENNLSAEIKLAAGKLNALEDFRLARIDLMNKFEEQEKRVAEQELRHKESLYEAEKSLIIGKAKMQTELEKRLSELAASFRSASDLRLAEATQRTVRENVALRRQLETLLRHCRQLDARRQDSQENERELRLVASLHEAEARLALGKVMRLHRRTERLALEQRAKSQAIGRSLRADKYARLSEAARRESSLDRHEELRKSRLLEQNIQKSREDRLGLCREAQQACQRIARLAHVLERAKRTVQQALAKTELRQATDRHEQYEQDQEDTCTDCLSDYKEHLLHSLANIFDEYSDDTDREPKELLEVHSVPSDDIYEFGQLGLIPAMTTSVIDVLSDNSSNLGDGLLNDNSKKTNDDSVSKCCCDLLDFA